MNQFQKSEEENEIYIAPGTNYVLKEAWQRHLVDHFHGTHAGTYVVDNHYVDLKPNGRAIVEPADFYQKVNGYWTPMHEDGFEFDANAMTKY